MHSKTPHTSTAAKSIYKHVIIIGNNIDSGFVSRISSAFPQPNNEVLIIGNGRSYVTKEELQQKLKGRVSGDTRVDISSHGGISQDGRYFIIMYNDKGTYTNEFFKDLREIVSANSPGPLKNVNLWSCYAGSAVADARELGTGSVFVAHAGMNRTILPATSVHGIILAGRHPEKYTNHQGFNCFIKSFMYSPDIVTISYVKDADKNIIEKHRVITSSVPITNYLDLCKYKEVEWDKFWKFIASSGLAKEVENLSAAKSPRILPEDFYFYLKYDFLYSVAHNDLSKTLKYIKANKALVNLKDEVYGAAALYMAVENDFNNMSQLLLNFGADPNQRLKDGSSPLIMAVQRGNARIFKMLADYGADLKVMHNGKTAIEMASYLLGKEIDISAKNPDKNKIAGWWEIIEYDRNKQQNQTFAGRVAGRSGAVAKL